MTGSSHGGASNTQAPRKSKRTAPIIGALLAALVLTAGTACTDNGSSGSGKSTTAATTTSATKSTEKKTTENKTTEKTSTTQEETTSEEPTTQAAKQQAEPASAGAPAGNSNESAGGSGGQNSSASADQAQNQAQSAGLTVDERCGSRVDQLINISRDRMTITCDGSWLYMEQNNTSSFGLYYWANENWVKYGPDGVFPGGELQCYDRQSVTAAGAPANIISQLQMCGEKVPGTY